MQQFMVLFREPDGRKDPHTAEPNVDQGSTDQRSITSPFPPEGKFPNDPEAEKIAQHRKNWDRWSEQMNKEHRIAGGMPLTLSGRVLHGANTQGANHGINEGLGPSAGEGLDKVVTEGPHKVGEENVQQTGSLQNVRRLPEKSNVCPSDKEPPVLSDIGGYLLINARDLDEATSLMQSCPIFEFGGYAEIRECMTLPAAQPRSGAGSSSSDISPSPETEPAASDAPLMSKAQPASEAEPSPTAPSLREYVRQTGLPNNVTRLHERADACRPSSEELRQSSMYSLFLVRTLRTSGTSKAPPRSEPPVLDNDPSVRSRNKAIVRRFNTAFIQDSDISAFHEIIDPSVINHTAPAGFSKGADGMRDIIELFRKALTGLEVKILRQVAEDDIVVTHKTFHATHTGPLMGIPPSGQPIVITIIDIVRLHNGKYIEHWGIRDMISSTRVLPKM